MDYETYTGNARLSSSANNEYTRRRRMQARARFRRQYERLARGDARESVGRLIFADETNCPPLSAL